AGACWPRTSARSSPPSRRAASGCGRAWPSTTGPAGAPTSWRPRRIPSGTGRDSAAAPARARRSLSLPGRGASSHSVLNRASLLAVLVLFGQALAQSPAIIPYPRDYTTHLVKYAVVDRVDGFSRDLYASPDAVEAVKRDPRLREFPAGALFALDVYSAKAL